MIMSTGPPAGREMKFPMSPKQTVCMFLSTAFENDLKQLEVVRTQTLTEEQELLHIYIYAHFNLTETQKAGGLIPNL